MAFEHKGQYYELPTETRIPRVFALRRVGKEINVFYNENRPESVIIRGSYLEEVVAIPCFLFGVFLIPIGVMLIMDYLS